MKFILILFWCTTSALYIQAQGTGIGNSEEIFGETLSKFSGKGTFEITTGVYKGDIENGYAHGNGVFFMNDGSFYKGHFKYGLFEGKGFLVIKNYGYVSGYWDQGTIFPDDNADHLRNPIIAKNTVKQVLKNDFPNSISVKKFTPEGYKIVEIDPTTKMGAKALSSLH